MENKTIEGVGFNVTHLSGFSQDQFIEEFSTPAMKETIWPGVKNREDKLKSAWKEIRKAANMADEEAPTAIVAAPVEKAAPVDVKKKAV